MIKQEQIINAQFKYWELKPNTIPKNFINDYETTINVKSFLKNISFSEKVLIIIIDIVLDKIRNNRRFQKKTTLSIIRSIIRKKPINYSLKTETINKLFEIYQSLIFLVNENLCWILSSLLMNQKLNQNQVIWLIENAENSVYILNRLLRYPFKNKNISNWANTSIKENKYYKRKSELIGKVLDYNLEFKYKNKDQWAWGVYYSSLTYDKKERMLINNLNEENFNSVVEILYRQKSYKAIKQIIETSYVK